MRPKLARHNDVQKPLVRCRHEVQKGPHPYFTFGSNIWLKQMSEAYISSSMWRGTLARKGDREVEEWSLHGCREAGIKEPRGSE